METPIRRRLIWVCTIVFFNLLGVSRLQWVEFITSWFCVWVYGPVNSEKSCRAGQWLKSLRGWPELVHLFSPEIDNCPSWISEKERMTVENIPWSISANECCWIRRMSVPQPSDHQSDAQLTEPPRWCLQSIPYLHAPKIFGQTVLSLKCRSRSNAAEHGTWSTLFATDPAALTFITCYCSYPKCSDRHTRANASKHTMSRRCSDVVTTLLRLCVFTA